MLRMESPAPPMIVKSWLRGQPLTSFQIGVVYIIEFWATSCGPSVAAMLYLARLQRKYRDSGLEVIGVASQWRASTTAEPRIEFDACLTETLSRLNYRVALDTDEMRNAWSDPRSSLAIPTSFVVDRDRHIAFVGSPTQLDYVLPKVVAGVWRKSDEAKALDAERISENRVMILAMTGPIYTKLRSAMKTEDWKRALSAVEEGIVLMPDSIEFRVTHALLLLHKLHDVEAGLLVMRQLVRDAIDKESELWMTKAISQLFDPTQDHDHIPRAERLAMGRDLSEKILALNPPEDEGYKFLSYGAVAQYCYESGDKERAIELVELALKSLDTPEHVPDGVKLRCMPSLLQALANYKKGCELRERQVRQ
ncbi:alkyl hydroperoxide reductase [Bradyrhizobium sp. NAS96.2]|nr:alkyl hydroperoxide reductase [Bradyrhizobium sp. NAS96.2]